MQIEKECAPEAAERLEPVIEVSARIAEDGIDRALLHLLELHAARLSGCTACFESHAAAARAVGIDEARIGNLGRWRRTELFSAKERAVLEWAEAIGTGDDPETIDAALREVSRHFAAGEQLPLGMAILAIHRTTCVHAAQDPRDLHAPGQEGEPPRFAGLREGR